MLKKQLWLWSFCFRMLVWKGDPLKEKKKFHEIWKWNNLVYLHVHEYSLLLRNFLLMISLHVLLLTFFKNVRRVKIIWLNFFKDIYYLETTVTKKEICLVIFIIYLFLKIKKVKYVFTPCKLICPSHTSLCLGYRE